MHLERLHTLPSGLRVRLRLTRSSDRTGICSLLEGGSGPGGLEPIALTRFDPRRRLVVCATALLDGHETVVGVGSIELGAPAPDVLIADERADGVGDLVARALVERADVVGRRTRAA
jgi:hypothetical protein